MSTPRSTNRNPSFLRVIGPLGVRLGDTSASNVTNCLRQIPQKKFPEQYPDKLASLSTQCDYSTKFQSSLISRVNSFN